MREFRFPLAVLIPSTVDRAHAQTVDGIEQAWRAWMAGHHRKTGGLAVVHGGRAVREAAMGQEAVGAPVPVASLSKAVTAVCVAGLIERGRLSFETPLSQALARTMARVGQPADPRLSAVPSASCWSIARVSTRRTSPTRRLPTIRAPTPG
jgi:CubicO group peptidase (beta-lactamase class C family)